jgi:hypothetical protein
MRRQLRHLAARKRALIFFETARSISIIYGAMQRAKACMSLSVRSMRVCDKKMPIQGSKPIVKPIHELFGATDPSVTEYLKLVLRSLGLGGCLGGCRNVTGQSETFCQLFICSPFCHIESNEPF